MNSICEYPPADPGSAFVISILQFLLSAYLEYISNKSPAKILASSPPAAPLISTMIFLSSLGSFGNNNTSSSFSIFSFSTVKLLKSSLASSAISLSLSNSLASSKSLNIFLYSLYFSTISDIDACSFDRAVINSTLLSTSGLDSSSLSSLYLFNVVSNLSIIRALLFC